MRRVPGVLLILLLGLQARAGEILSGPVLHASAPGTMTVTWTTAEESTGELRYGMESLSRIATEQQPATRHLIQLDDLEPGRRYRYQVSGGPGGTFRAGPDGDAPFRFTVSGDTRTQHLYHRTVLDRIMALRPDLHINTGDLVADGGSPVLWEYFFKIEHDLLRHVPFLPVVGNHDRSEQNLFQDTWRLPGVREDSCTYALRYGNTLFLVLDDSRIEGGGGQQDLWLLAELEAARQDASLRHIIPLWHVPPLSSGTHANAPNRHMLGWMHAAFKQAGVRVVFNGHDHDYERSLYDGIHYVVAGGGGAPQYGVMSTSSPCPQEHSVVFDYSYNYVLVDVAGDRLVLTTYNIDGDRIDHVEIE